VLSREVLPPNRRMRTTGVIAMNKTVSLWVKQSLENSGTPNAKCSKKQYGSGWVTVCE